MALKPGHESSEWKYLKWLGMAAGAATAIGAALASMGTLSADHWVYLVIGVVVAVAKAAGDYSKSRGVAKASEIAGEGLLGELDPLP